MNEVKEGLFFLDSEQIPWDLNIQENNKDEALKIINKIQDRFEDYYKAIFDLLMFSKEEEK